MTTTVLYVVHLNINKIENYHIYRTLVATLNMTGSPPTSTNYEHERVRLKIILVIFGYICY